MKASDGFTIHTAIAGLIVFTAVAVIIWFCVAMRWFDALPWLLFVGLFGGMAVAAKIESALKAGTAGKV